jgi:hypothetical protein
VAVHGERAVAEIVERELLLDDDRREDDAQRSVSCEVRLKPDPT